MAIFERAATRAQEAGHAYAGDLSPVEAFALFRAVPGARLIDVRTLPEVEFVGMVHDSLHIPWQIYPEMQINPAFADEVLARASSDDVLMFLCRSGARSVAAATFMTARGCSRCYNVLEGFEGGKDAQGRRGFKEGWKVAGLPWVNL
ncbi:rhodanese-like domain-containing protein [Thermithiobacillus plumbiphilus]|uniref:Rhodanese-like domain-containing protein n=1 Tax=Thermithiobacillus plumbiphilus TaxID=1729899 RepID=A0ABU9D9G9_9PROT